MPASTLSDTDLKLFLKLSNPEKTNQEVDDDEAEEADGEEDEEEEEEGEEEEDDGEEDEEDDDEAGVPDLSGGSRAASRVSAAAASHAGSGVAPAAPMTREEIEYAKTSVLLELERLRGLGCKLTREYTMDDDLAEMEYEARRHVLMLEEQNNVNMMKDGLRLFVSGCEFANSKFGPFLNLDGFSQSFSSELGAGKHNMTLSKLHRKYFKTPVSSAPEMELAMALCGAMAMHHFQRSVMHKIMPAAPARPATHFPNVPPAADDDSDEELPPSFMP